LLGLLALLLCAGRSFVLLVFRPAEEAKGEAKNAMVQAKREADGENTTVQAGREAEEANNAVAQVKADQEESMKAAMPATPATEHATDDSGEPKSEDEQSLHDPRLQTPTTEETAFEQLMTLRRIAEQRARRCRRRPLSPSRCASGRSMSASSTATQAGAGRSARAPRATIPPRFSL
jgi:hypothetical protein